MNHEEYQTKDLGEVAALVTSGCELKSIQWKDNTAYFLFRDPVRCTELQNQYYFSGLQVNARAYYDSLRMVKRKLYTQASGPRRTDL